MSRVIQNKYIDLNQFPKSRTGGISWKDSVGMTVKFMFNDEEHTIKIVEQISKDYLKVELDSVLQENPWHTTKIKNLTIENYFYKPEFKLSVGEVINNCEIIKKFKKQTKGKKKGSVVNRKYYTCKCLIDGYEFETCETDLLMGSGCPVCSHTVVLKGFNDFGSVHPELIKYLVNKQDAYTNFPTSRNNVMVVCKDCGYERMMPIGDLSSYGSPACPKCSDGLSYPNKFAREFFKQLNGQYCFCDHEHKFEWSGKLSYDNYIVLNDGTEMVVEMDGGQHYVQRGVFEKGHVNDKIKDLLAEEHGITVVRINCNYSKQHDRFNYVRTNMERSLGCYFDLSNINWEECNGIATSSKIIMLVNYYNENKKVGIQDLADKFLVSKETARSYLKIGEELGLCTYDRKDVNRTRNNNYISAYDLNGNFIKTFLSMTDAGKELCLDRKLISKSIKHNKPYKGYIFKHTTRNEWLSS